MPELPEVEALAGFLRERLSGCVVVGVEVAAISVLKTFDPPPSALAGLTVTAVNRRGKWIDIDVDGLHLVMHLARAGWLRWYEQVPERTGRPSKGPLALRVRFEDPGRDGDGAGPGFDLTEAGTRKGLAVHVVRDPASVPGIATLGPDPLDPAFDLAALRTLVAGSRQQIKGLLREQSVIAGVGNAYSDEVLHTARISPFAAAGRLSEQQLAALYAALVDTLTTAVATAAGRPAAELKDAKRSGMRVHGRAGQVCPVCGDVVREVSFADRSLQYCATCQTEGAILADRRTSKFLR